jgi:hypothetical protein
MLLFAVLLLVAVGCEKEVEVTREIPKEVIVTQVVKETVVETVVQTETVVQEVEVTREVIVEVEPPVDVPFEELWASSGHADVEAEAFIHWNEDDPKEVPTGCAKCHSTPGYLDFLGVDGSEAGVVDIGAPVGSTVECVACHNAATAAMTSVMMPSGMELTGLGPEARCMQCHQGRASAATVDKTIADAGLEDMDTVSPDLGFTNIHYFAAAATQYGTRAMGGYQYEGKTYDGKFDHVAGFNTCVGCHNSHTLELKVEACAECHTDVASVEDLKDVRMLGSLVDYDGDGDVEEGIYYEIETLQEILYAAMQAYAAETTGSGLVYDAARYPYFFNDAGERFASWTGRLAKAAYNYQTSLKDPGAFAHGGKYIIELLYDSIEDLNPDLIAGLHRIDHGHFASSEEAFRHWDADGEVQASCAKCHSSTGLPFFLANNVIVAQPLAGSLNCATCHNDLSTYTRYEVAAVTFPNGTTLDSGSPDGNLCLNCHQGRESTVSVNRRITGAGVGDDEVTDQLSFVNVHYFAAGATLFGGDAQGAYQYEGKEYVGRNEHIPAFSTCIQCHSTHALEVEVQECADCHEGVESVKDLEAIRIDPTDWDGDGDVAEGVAGEIETMREALYAALQDYTANTVGTPIVYNPASYPYFFTEAGERYVTWTPRLLRAAYNYQYAQKDPGGFAHNGKYILQTLYDSLEDLDAVGAGMIRP